MNVITGQRPNLVQPLIDRAKRLAPEAPETYRYSAIYNANTFFQYETALDEIERYLELRPRAAFGHRMRGFLLYRLRRYADSNKALEQAVRLEPNHDYAYALMSRNYALLAQSASGSAKRRFAEQALSMQHKAAAAPAADAQRISWLKRWLERRLG